MILLYIILIYNILIELPSMFRIGFFLMNNNNNVNALIISLFLKFLVDVKTHHVNNNSNQ